MKPKNIVPFTIKLFLFLFIATLIYSCKCAQCLNTPPPLNAYATALIAKDHSLDSAVAAEWINRYIANKDSICNNMVGSFDSVLTNSEAFNKQSLLNLLCLKDCIGLRMNYGMDSSFKVHIVITGVNQSGDDIYYQNKTVEKGQPGQ